MNQNLMMILIEKIILWQNLIFLLVKSPRKNSTAGKISLWNKTHAWQINSHYLPHLENNPTMSFNCWLDSENVHVHKGILGVKKTAIMKSADKLLEWENSKQIR